MPFSRRVASEIPGQCTREACSLSIECPRCTTCAIHCRMPFNHSSIRAQFREQRRVIVSQPPICQLCGGLFSGTAASACCDLCQTERNSSCHNGCCTRHFSCGNCNNRRSLVLDSVCRRCGFCVSCCACLEDRCLHCRVRYESTGSHCVICLRCANCCACTDRRSLSTLRALSRTAFRILQNSQQSRSNRVAVATRVREEKGVLFLPSGLGKPIELSAGFLNIHIEKLSDLFGITPELKDNKYYLPMQPYAFKENTSKRFLVPEIEVANLRGEKADVDLLVKTWLGKIVGDGSLPSTGFEINLQPANGDLYVRMINEVCASLTQVNAVVDSSCGLHVHVDSRDFDPLDIRKLVFLYEQCEPALYACLPTNRHTSRFCIPSGRSYANYLRQDELFTLEEVRKDNKMGHKKVDLKRGTIEMVFGKGQKPVSSSKYGSGAAHDVRYRGLNLYSHFFRGSAEFRHAPGSVDPQFIIDWSLLCCGIVDTAKTLSEKQILALSKTLTGLSKDQDLYRLAFKPKEGIEAKATQRKVLEASTRILKEICQKRVGDFIDLQQELQVTAAEAKKQKGMTSGDF